MMEKNKKENEQTKKEDNKQKEEAFKGAEIEEGEENPEEYGKGGYHPVKIGEIYKKRYKVLTKIGWGYFSTVWLAEDIKYGGKSVRIKSGEILKPQKYVALKIVKSSKIFAQVAIDEIKLLLKSSEFDKNNYSHVVHFGMNPNDDKTKKTLIPKENLYLGIWLDKKTHLKFNLDKVKANFKKLINILQQKNFSNGLKIQFFKAVLHSQLLYGLEIFNLTKTDFKGIDTWINKKITKFLLINTHSPRLIYKTGAKIDPVRITIYKRRFKLIQKLKILHFDELINYLPFRKKESENINWYSKNLKQLENELDNFIIKILENSPSWKVQEYLKIVQINNTINKQQRYLKWKGSTSILKLRNFTNYLNRYSYVMNKNKSKLCELCKKMNNLDIIEDLDHFLWNCSAYENNRKIWISELKKINISNILNNNNITNIIIKKDLNCLLALVGNKLIFDSLIKFLIIKI
ncbi:srsf protein kinase [Anaeramoeba flamelloides]|uniref:non-specific serine/threonine protein kinase n=1 Tax=Anaeramoeba flamelloides TaxID=1746091 RepID=A0AAV7ZK24_9EUKA|nr:srsf protein kinase [Anaeramoeba flamelloides]